MSTLTAEAIKEAIAKLPEEDKVSMAAWLDLGTMDEWEREMQCDFAPGGRGAKFLEQVKKEVAEGIADGSIRPIEKASRSGGLLEVSFNHHSPVPERFHLLPQEIRASAANHYRLFSQIDSSVTKCAASRRIPVDP